MYKNGFGINSLQWLMCYKTKPNQIKHDWNSEFSVLYVSHDAK